MKCPHCLVSFFPNWENLNFQTTNDPDFKKFWIVRHLECPNCHRTVVEKGVSSAFHLNPTFELIYPKGISRAPLDIDIPAKFSVDYKEACMVITDSAKASAALSRRCLQIILRDVANVTKSDLSKEIQELLDSKSLPSYIADDLDAIRNIGNFAAHPIKSTSTGEIVEVEPGEAEWNLDVIEELFDFYFVQPKKSQAKRIKLNEKLKDAGKPPMKVLISSEKS